MRGESLPSPGRINRSHALRRLAAKAISYGEVVRGRSPESDALVNLNAFFTACAAACGASVACAFPLDDDGTLADMFTLSVLPMDTPGYQTFTFTNQADNAVYIALPAGALTTANFPRPASPMAVQYRVPVAALPASSAARYGALMVVVLSAEGAPIGNARVVLTGYGAAAIALGSGGYGELYVNDIAGAQTEFATSIVGKSTAIYVNADGSLGYTVAGVDVGVIPGLTVGATDRVFFALRHADIAGGGGLGVTFSGEFITDIANITEPVPEGSISICDA